MPEGQTDRHVVIAGGTGFLGILLHRYLSAAGYAVTILSRRRHSQSAGTRIVSWDGRSTGDWCRELEGAMAVINLAGRSVDCRYTARNRRAIWNSRIDSTRAIGQAISRCDRPPAVWLNSSTATIYKHTLAEPMEEATGVVGATLEAKDAFSVEVAQAWEDSVEEFPTKRTRKVLMRTAMVFGKESGQVFHVLRRLCRLGLGGPMGAGTQFVSWIHEMDFYRSVIWVLEHPSLSGPINFAAPNPLTNALKMQHIRTITGRRFGLPIPSLLLEIGAFLLRTETELVIKSRRVIPRKLMESGFRFEFPTLPSAIDNLEQSLSPQRVSGSSIRRASSPAANGSL
jgi:uncharacterized protein (TIGR01777 family)